MSESAAVDYDSMPFDQFVSEMTEKMDSAEALFSVDKLDEAESVWNEIAVTRRVAMITLTKSGPELINMVMEDREAALAYAELLDCLGHHLQKMDSLKEILEHAQWRVMMALAHREDMQSVFEEARKQH